MAKVDFEALINKHVTEDGSIPAANISKLASAISSAVGRKFVDKDRYAVFHAVESTTSDDLIRN